VEAGAPGAGAADPDRDLAEAGEILGRLIATAVPGWVEASVARLVAAYRLAGATVDERAVTEAAGAAGAAAARAVEQRLAVLLAADVDDQDTTPLAVVRGAVVHPTAVLRRAGVPPVRRDAFDEARFPDDPYGLTPASLAELDPSLAEPALVWGAAKARAHRARHGPAPR